MEDQTFDEGTTGEVPESGVITNLRKQLKEATQRAAEWDEARTEAASSQLAAAGFPKLTAVFLSKVEGFPTPEKVGSFLDELGLAKAQEEQKPIEGDKPEGGTAEELAGLTGLGQQVASAATGALKNALNDRIAAAKDSQELQQIMAEAGLLSHE
jgi:hypothetical protein